MYHSRNTTDLIKSPACIHIPPTSYSSHDSVIKWKHFPRYWPFVRGIQRSPVNCPHKCQWRGAVMFSLLCVRRNGWVNNREAGDLRRHRAHYDVIVMHELELNMVFRNSWGSFVIGNGSLDNLFWLPWQPFTTPNLISWGLLGSINREDTAFLMYFLVSHPIQTGGPDILASDNAIIIIFDFNFQTRKNGE